MCTRKKNLSTFPVSSIIGDFSQYGFLNTMILYDIVHVHVCVGVGCVPGADGGDAL
jgi:hypothetical protein